MCTQNNKVYNTLYNKLSISHLHWTHELPNTISSYSFILWASHLLIQSARQPLINSKHMHGTVLLLWCFYNHQVPKCFLKLNSLSCIEPSQGILNLYISYTSIFLICYNSCKTILGLDNRSEQMQVFLTELP